mgnify:FL=1
MVVMFDNTNDNIDLRGRMMEVKVHQFLEGPIDQGDKWALLCMVEEKGLLFDDEIYFKDFNEAYNFMNKLKSSVEPILHEKETSLWIH